jgi:phenylacetate-CoA ligase
VALKRGFYPSAAAFEYMPPAAQAFVRVLRLSQTDPDLLEKLNAYQPTVLTGYANVLESLAQEVDTGRLQLEELKQVVNNSETLTDAARKRMQAAFGVHVMDNYATGECPFLSNGCRVESGAHVNADWAVLEVVDENYRPVPPGTPGKKVLITNLANTVQPIIRYEVGDVVTMADAPCGCGSVLPRIQTIDGRTSDAFWIWDGIKYRRVLSSVFKQAVDYLREVREWQAVQCERNRFQLLLEPLPGAVVDALRARQLLHRQLEACGLQGVIEVDLQTVRALDADPATGKFRRVVSLVGTPEDLPGTLRELTPAPASSPAKLLPGRPAYAAGSS